MGPELSRCGWCSADPLYIAYHDQEWGVPINDDQLLFEFLILEGAQAGLSWLTILRKRANYRHSYHNFAVARVAAYSEDDVLRLLGDAGIVRNRRKIESSIRNAQAFIKVQHEFGSFAAYMWRFVNGRPLVNHWQSLHEIPAKTPLSDKISADLQARGFSFVGSTIVYSHMQATGMVNDHVTTCYRHRELAALGAVHII